MTNQALNAYEVWHQRRAGVPVLNTDETERWYRLAQPNGQARYGYGDEIEAEAWAHILTDQTDLEVNRYVAVTVDDIAEIARLDGGNDGVNLADELEALALDSDDHMEDRDMTTTRTTVVECECGRITGNRCLWSGPIAETVVVEWMPPFLRASHVAAGNRGDYAANGAERLRLERSCAETIVEGDDEWASVVAR